MISFYGLIEIKRLNSVTFRKIAYIVLIMKVHLEFRGLAAKLFELYGGLYG